MTPTFMVYAKIGAESSFALPVHVRMLVSEVAALIAARSSHKPADLRLVFAGSGFKGSGRSRSSSRHQPSS